MKLKKIILFSKTDISQSLNLICFFFLVFGLFYIAAYTYENLYIDVFTARDIRRALGWLNGDFYWPGPEMFSGSSLPGPFFYFLLFPPLLFGGNIYSQFLIWRIIWLALSYTAAFHFTGQICKHKESLFIFVMFLIACIGPSLFSPILFSSNPTFSVTFHILAIIALYHWKATDKNKYLYFLGLIIGLGVQVHALVPIHMLTALILFLRRKKKPWKPFLWFMVLIVLPCLPYFIFHYSYAFDTLKSAIKQSVFIKYIMFPSELWISSFYAITSFKSYLIGPTLLFVLLFLYQTGLKKIFPFSSSTINLAIIIAPPVFLFCLIGGHWWYLYSIPVILMILFTKLYDDLIPNQPDKKWNHLILCGVLFILPLVKQVPDFSAFKMYIEHPEHLIVTGLFLVLICLIVSAKKITLLKLGKLSILLIVSFLHFVSKDYTKNIAYYFSSLPTFPSDTFDNHWMTYYINSKYHFLKPFLQQIALDTNWQTETAVKRTYIIGGVYRDASLWALYSLAKEQLKTENTNSLSENVKHQSHGYFAVAHLKPFINYIQSDWREYLSHSPYVSSFVQKEIQTGSLLLYPPKLYNRYWLIPYKITEQSAFAEGFYNFGQSYYWEEPHWLKTCPSTKSFTHNNSDLYYCMILPGHLQRAGVHITIPQKIHTSFIEVSFFGPMLGLKAENALEDGYAYWSDIQFSLFCNNQKFMYPLPNIGHNLKQHFDPVALSKSLNAPLKLKIPITCRTEEISKINLKFKHWKRRLWVYSEIIPEQRNITWNISR